MQTSSPPPPSRQSSQAPATVSLGYPTLFHWVALVVLLGVLVFAAFKNIVPLLVAAVFLVVLAALSRAWSRYALRRLTLNISADHDRASPGEKVELTFELANQGWPLPWLEVELEMPYKLAEGKKPASPYAGKRLRWVTSLSSGQVITWKQTIEAKARGDYRVGPVRLRSGDIFGLFPKESAVAQFQSLLVYPRVFSGRLALPRRALFGEQTARRSIYEDTSRVAGARDYRYDDSFKHIHWKATAARGSLQTRLYESSTSLSLLLIIDVSSFPEEDDDFEQAVSTVASLAYEAHRQGLAVGVIGNSEPEVRIAPGSGRGQLLQILEALARITAISHSNIYEYMDRQRASLPYGATLVMVTRARTPQLSALVYHLEREGHLLHVVNITSGQPQPATPVGSMATS